MRELAPELAAHLAGGVTTLCHCWRLIRRDGVAMGFTDHDEPIHLEGIWHAPHSGFSASEAEARFSLSGEAGEVVGALSGAAISPQDIARGLYDGARVETYRVNWAAPSQHLLLRVETIGEIVQSGALFRVELRGLKDELNRVRGRYFQRRCDAVVGDSRCRVNLSDPRFAADVTVLAIIGESRIRVGGLSGFADGWFTDGLLSLVGDGLAPVRILHHQGDTLGLVRAFQGAVAASGRVSAGCDRRLATCRDKFANQINFQGFPHMPGDDFALSYPARGGGNDGSAIS